MRQNNENLHRSILHAFSYCIVFTLPPIFTASKGMYAKTYMPNVSKKTSMQRKKIVNVFIPDDSTILHIQTTLNYSPKSFHICGHCSCMRAIFATSFNSPFIFYAPFGMCFSSIRFVCLINVKHFQNNGYNEYKYNEWSRKCGFSVLATA